MLLPPNAAPLPQDVQQLQHMLQAETEQKERALAKVVMLEAEISALKTALATHSAIPVEAEVDNAEFNGQLIMVVDDQTLNLDLIEALLEDCNLNLVCKSSAADALAFIKTSMPDLILMDIQMPVMDGYTATAQIRAQQADKQPVILAMTANNSEEDTHKSLAAGMQGHLCKPIDATLLINQLFFWLQQQPARDPSATALNSSAAHVETGELPGIDLAAALARLRGNRALLEEVLISFADKAALIIPELRTAIDGADSEAATRILHRLKGTAANLSAVKVAPLAAKLETQSKQGQLPSEEELTVLDTHIKQLITTAQRIHAGSAPSTEAHEFAQQTNPAAIKQCLESIRTHLNSDLGQAEDAVQRLLQLCQNTAWMAAANQLRTLFYQFNLRAVHDLITNGFEQESP